ncbi:MAG: hypothetical protein KC462_08515, partial [Cyanobacteria bacterium HKST-UBA05]|nr:hypothetical protein [Cyanobacteria bacterium HKST-UBA05]
QVLRASQDDTVADYLDLRNAHAMYIHVTPPAFRPHLLDVAQRELASDPAILTFFEALNASDVPSLIIDDRQPYLALDNQVQHEYIHLAQERMGLQPTVGPSGDLVDDVRAMGDANELFSAIVYVYNEIGVPILELAPSLRHAASQSAVPYENQVAAQLKNTGVQERQAHGFFLTHADRLAVDSSITKLSSDYAPLWDFVADNAHLVGLLCRDMHEVRALVEAHAAGKDAASQPPSSPPPSLPGTQDGDAPDGNA